MEEFTFSHIPIATLITAFMVIAPIIEWIGYRRKDARMDRFAKSLIWFSMILFSPGAALGTGIPMIIIGLYPEFWARFANLFFWPLVVQFGFFLLEVAFLFFFYYLVWDRWQGAKKKLHIIMGFVAMAWGLLIQFVWDAVGAYMMTPNGVQLPGALEATGWSAQAFFNQSVWPLFTHRFFGNISYAMLLVGGIFAIKYFRAKSREESDYFRFSSDLSFSIGFLAFFAMPFIGWAYSKVLQINAPVAYHAIMGGHSAKFFYVKLILIAFFVTVGSAYVFIRHREKKILHISVSVLLAALYIVLTLHPPLHWWPGGAFLWRASYTVILGGFIAFMWYLRAKAKDFNIRRKIWPIVMFLAGIAAFFTFAFGAFSRERVRQPHSVYGQLAKPETTEKEAARFLIYEQCLSDHSVREISSIDFDGWDDERILSLCNSGNFSDQQAEIVVRALREGKF